MLRNQWQCMSLILYLEVPSNWINFQAFLCNDDVSVWSYPLSSSVFGNVSKYKIYVKFTFSQGERAH